MKSITLACALALILESNLAAQTAVPCAAPGGLLASAVTATASAQTVTVSWTPVRGAVGYAVIRKNPDATCWNVTPQGTTATSLQETMLPGGNYEYQVAAQLIKGQGLSEWAPVTVMPSLATTTPLPVRAPAPTITVMPAGPAWLNVGSDMPGRMVVIWAPVPNAAAYRFHSSITAGTTLMEFGVINAATAERDPLTGGIRIRDHLLNADTTFTWWYGIKALYVNGNDTTASTMSPVAHAKSLPNDGPTGLQHTLTPSIGKPGMLKLTLAWNPALPGVTGYRAEVREIRDKHHNYRVIATTEFSETMTSLIVDATGPYGSSTPFNYMIADIRPRQLIELCVQSKWPLFKVPVSNFSCVTIQT